LICLIVAIRGDAQSLAFRCADLLPIFKIGLEKLSPSDAKLYGDRVVATFEKVEKQYTQWAGWSAFNQAVHFRSIGEKIAGLKGEVALRLQDFQVSLLLASINGQLIACRRPSRYSNPPPGKNAKPRNAERISIP
jgi:hypothetical protein